MTGSGWALSRARRGGGRRYTEAMLAALLILLAPPSFAAGARVPPPRLAPPAVALGPEAAGKAPAVAALDDQALAAFIEARSVSERRRRLDLFQAKMRKAAASDFAFYRAFPDLFYDLLARSPEADAVRASPEVLADGDGHAQNVEVVELEGRPLPQFNDFDDAGKAPAALDMARTLGAAAVLGHSDDERRALAAEAKAAYLDSLALSFDQWRRKAAEEAAVKTGPVETKHWREHGGAPVTDKALAAKLFALAGLDPDKWVLLDRAGAGLSSIGLRRYLFAHRKKDHARELKELRAPAVAVFTGDAPVKQGPRVAQAYARLREVPVDLTTAEGLGAEWMLRRREAEARSLNLEHPRSTARVLGGLLAQVHRAQTDAAALERAMRGLSERSAAGWLAAMGRMREGLARLLAAGRWDRG